MFSQVLSDPGGSGDGPCTVLAVVVQEAVLTQYEAVCEAAGLIPRSGCRKFAIVQLMGARDGACGSFDR